MAYSDGYKCGGCNGWIYPGFEHVCASFSAPVNPNWFQTPLPPQPANEVWREGYRKGFEDGMKMAEQKLNPPVSPLPTTVYYNSEDTAEIPVVE